MFHSRCHSIEALLRGENGDLRNRIQELEQQREREIEVHSSEKKELLDRLLAVTNPAAVALTTRAQRAATPVAPMPLLHRAAPRRLPGQSSPQGAEPRPGVGPVLSPPSPPVVAPVRTDPDTEAAG